MDVEEVVMVEEEEREEDEVERSVENVVSVDDGTSEIGIGTGRGVGRGADIAVVVFDIIDSTDAIFFLSFISEEILSKCSSIIFDF